MDQSPAVRIASTAASSVALAVAVWLSVWHIDWLDSAGPLLAYVMPVAFCVVAAGSAAMLVETLHRVSQMDADGI